MFEVNVKIMTEEEGREGKGREGDQLGFRALILPQHNSWNSSFRPDKISLGFHFDSRAQNLKRFLKTQLGLMTNLKSKHCP